MILCTEQGRRLESDIDAAYQKTGNLLGAIADHDARLTTHARFLSSMGISHRGFLVGGTIPSLLLADWVEGADLEQFVRFSVPIGNIVLLEGANNSPVEGSPRNCPELSMCGLAEIFAEKDIGRLIFGHIYTAAPGNRKLIATSSGYEAPTLPPCDTCRPVIEGCPASWPDMPYTTLAYDGPARQDRPWQEIYDMHEGYMPPMNSQALLKRTAAR